MKKIVHNPEGIYSTGGDYHHAIEIREPRRLVYVSGTMGIDRDGNVATTLDEQLELIWGNIESILSSAGMTVHNIVRVTSYLRDAAYVQANQEARVKALKGNIVPTTAIVVQTLQEDWLVEIEVIAAE